MKKILHIFVVLLLSLVVLLTFGACTDRGADTNANSDTNSNTETEENTDTNSNTEIEENTDTSTDEECEHIVAVLPAIQATCTQKGLTEGLKCVKCDTIITKQYQIIELGHDYIDNEAKEPTCTEVGWAEHQTCSRCDFSTRQEINALGHTKEIVEAVEPTCAQNGFTEGEKCSACDKIFLEQTVVKALGHFYVDDVCQRCGSIEINTVVLVVDISSSMQKIITKKSRFYALLDAVKELVLNIEDNSCLSVVAFDDQAHSILEPKEMNDVDREALYTQIEYKLRHTYFLYYLNPDGTESDIVVNKDDSDVYTSQGYKIPSTQNNNVYDKVTGEMIKAHGTRYTSAFTMASEFLFPVADSTCDKRVLFVTDGEPGDAPAYMDVVNEIVSYGAQIDVVGIFSDSNERAKERLAEIAATCNGNVSFVDTEEELKNLFSPQ